LNTGILLNKTDGGEGVSNPSDETRRKIASRKYGNEVSTKMLETKKKRNIPIGTTSEIALKGVETRRKNGNLGKNNPKKATQTIHLSNRKRTDCWNTEEKREKARKSRELLRNREEVAILRKLSKEFNIKLGSGWVEKSLDWIINKINEIKNYNDHS
jgi:hypothetical protein